MRMCPMEKLLGKKLGEDKCEKCYFWRDGRCSHKKIMAESEEKSKSRLPELGKRAAAEAKRKGLIDEETAKKIEETAFELSKKDEYGWLGKLRSRLRK